jgi:hypothetical protein
MRTGLVVGQRTLRVVLAEMKGFHEVQRTSERAG